MWRILNRILVYRTLITHRDSEMLYKLTLTQKFPYIKLWFLVDNFKMFN